MQIILGRQKLLVFVVIYHVLREADLLLFHVFGLFGTPPTPFKWLSKPRYLCVNIWPPVSLPYMNRFTEGVLAVIIKRVNPSSMVIVLDTSD